MVIHKPSLISTFLTDGMTIGMTTRVASHASKNPDPTFIVTSIRETHLFCFISCIGKHIKSHFVNTPLQSPKTLNFKKVLTIQTNRFLKH